MSRCYSIVKIEKTEKQTHSRVIKTRKTARCNRYNEKDNTIIESLPYLSFTFILSR